MTVTGIYALEESVLSETVTYYELLETLERNNKNDCIVIVGDFNATVKEYSS
jgi:hypothetical protein